MPKKSNPHATIRANGVPNPERGRSTGAKITHPKTAGALHRKRLFRLLDESGIFKKGDVI
jgi:hypothetical protein